MIDRLIIEEQLYLAVLKLQDIHWEVAQEEDTFTIIKEIEKVQLELQNIKKGLMKAEENQLELNIENVY
ncbi:hypothetical protein ACTNDN_24625 [Niallia sp. HCP3S3_B10]|uniref:hypothetical protein n=1 Tax=unclassified Niallia TaxID=2837522 RepID=UPI00203E0665|nr:hypothetical protein [Niallia sp. MER TA 168]MCM3365066.1 hypothetical protein [Niallia sp. MER TA 168]